MHSGLFYQKYRKLLSKIPFTLHQIACNPDKHWGCERWRVKLTLHHPSPTLHLISVPVTIEACSWSSMMATAGHQWWLQLGINDGQAIFYKKVFSQNNVRVKGGEGWWRAEATLHLSHPQCLSGLQAKRWRVKGKKESSIFTSRTPHDYWARGVVESKWQSWGILSPDVSFLAWQWHKVALARGNILP